ncbi:DNA-3-methyladenine glycosylase 2 [Nocardioides mesophilus]|uniref:DNA-3-methyladenine glycosylase II n=1 Tax=Nocardioides mesophilus TaxID=433659 RepID=A0A7G9R906_9ACTN|nr:DNA-3-methyladenine glycosylase 2 [Nocardioides mesophilus]QNN52081.1 DNA-3-methyladenine glycosylase 2 family protein [Nocardioides mesophilus]
MDIEDTEACYRAVKARDRRFDGVFYTGVTSTGIYCRPSCPAITPQRRNVTFHRTAAAAQAAGFRACKRCLPDATPGSPDWDVAADLAGRAMRLIADGVVERDGVEGLARRVGYTSRHLNRLLVAELGAGPLALARARRAQTGRILIETTAMPFADVAFAAGFASIRQFNDTIREVYAASPTELRAARAASAPGRGRSARAVSPAGAAATDRADGVAGQLELRLAVRAPYAAAEMLTFLAVHAVAGVEAAGPGWYARTLRLPHGPGRVVLELDDGVGARGHVRCRLQVGDLRDVAAAVERCRRLLDADCDPLAVEDALSADVVLARLVRSRPGLRVPGHVDGDEVAIRTVIGQQVSLAAAATVTGRLVERYGEPCGVAGGAAGADDADRLFPRAEVLAGLDPEELPMPRSRGRALVALCRALADGEIPLDRSMDRDDVRSRMMALPGIGPWTADYVALRALGHPDVFLPTDIGVRNALRGLGEPVDRLAARAEQWRPWRSYALLHLWSSLALLRPADPDPTGRSRDRVDRTVPTSGPGPVTKEM